MSVPRMSLPAALERLCHRLSDSRSGEMPAVRSLPDPTGILAQLGLTDSGTDGRTPDPGRRARPPARVPNLRLPTMNLPDLHMPDLHMPDLTLPDLTLPDLTLPDGLRGLLGKLMPNETADPAIESAAQRRW